MGKLLYLWEKWDNETASASEKFPPMKMMYLDEFGNEQMTHKRFPVNVKHKSLIISIIPPQISVGTSSTRVEQLRRTSRKMIPHNLFLFLPLFRLRIIKCIILFLSHRIRSFPIWFEYLLISIIILIYTNHHLISSFFSIHKILFPWIVFDYDCWCGCGWVRMNAAK